MAQASRRTPSQASTSTITDQARSDTHGPTPAASAPAKYSPCGKR